MTRSKRKDPLVWGIILIIVGALFLLQNTIDIWWTIARLWPVLLIAWPPITDAQRFASRVRSQRRSLALASPEGRGNCLANPLPGRASE